MVRPTGTTVYAVAATCSFAIALVKNFVYALLLQPAGFGEYSLIVLGASLSTYFCTLGMADGLFREVPSLIGMGLPERAREIRNAVVTATLLLSVVVGALISGAIALLPGIPSRYRDMAYIGAMVIAAVQFNIFMVDLRGRGLQQALGYMLLVKTCLSMIAGVALARYGAGAVAGGEAVSIALVVLLSIALYARDLRISLPSFNCVYPVARLGLPFALSNLVHNLTLNMASWFVAITFGAYGLGQYTFAMFMFLTGGAVLEMLSTSVGPAVVREYARSRNFSAAYRQIMSVSLKVVACFALSAAPFFLAIGPLISHFYPKYMPAMYLLPFVFIATLLHTANLFDLLFLARAEGRYPLAINVSTIFVLAILYGCAILLSLPLWTFAAIFCSGRIIAVSARFFFVRRAFLVAG